MRVQIPSAAAIIKHRKIKPDVFKIPACAFLDKCQLWGSEQAYIMNFCGGRKEMEIKQGINEFLLNPKAESYAAIIFAVGLATAFMRIMPFGWYLPSYYADLVNLMQNIVVMTSSVISGILCCIMGFFFAHLLACSLIAFFLIAVLYLQGLLRSAWPKK